MQQRHKDLLASSANQLWRLFTGPLSMLLIPLYLTAAQQGYWYLFGSISALSIFADLGFSNIIMQFAAHEFAFLKFDEQGGLTGDEARLKRLGSFYGFAMKWIRTISAVVFPLIYAVGIGFFVRDGVLGAYILPWTIFSIGSLLNFYNGSILCFISGLNRIAGIEKIRFNVGVANFTINTALLICHAGVYALAVGCFISSASISISLLGKFRPVLMQLKATPKDFSCNWRREVLPLFIRYAISFSSGYFLFQIYTPLMHYFHGPINSGKVGITVTLVMAIFSMSNIWMYTVTPKLNMLVSQKNWPELDRLFRVRMCLGAGTYLIIAAGVFAFCALFGDFRIVSKVIARFLPPAAFGTLLLCYFIQFFVNGWALYLRGHKQEPYVIPSVCSAAWVAVTTFLCGKFLPPDYFFLGFLSSYVWGIPVFYVIYCVCRKRWHAAVEAVPVSSPAD